MAEVELVAFADKVTEQLPSLPPSIDLFKIKLKYYFWPFIFMLATCFFLVLFIASGVTGFTLENVHADTFYDLFYIQAVTTVLGIVLSISELCLAVTGIWAFIKIYEVEEREKMSKTKKKFTTTNQKGKIICNKVNETPPESFTWQSALSLFVGLLFLNFSMLCIFWGFTNASIYPYLQSKSYFFFIFMDILIGIVSPFCLMIGLTIVLLVAQKLTDYRFRAESVVPGILSFVAFERGNEYCFWVIAKFFYFPTDKDDKPDPGQKLTWIQTKLNINLSSWFITMILFLNTVLAVMYITDAVIVEEKYGDKCSDIGEEFDCFIHSLSRSYVNCSANESLVADLDCFRIISIRETYTKDPLGSLIKAIFLFIATEKFLLLLFNLVKTLINFRHTRIWSWMVLVVGFLMVGTSFTCIVLYYADHDTGFAFLSILQFTILSMDVLLSGFLLLLGSPMEVVTKGKPAGRCYRALSNNESVDIDDCSSNTNNNNIT